MSESNGALFDHPHGEQTALDTSTTPAKDSVSPTAKPPTKAELRAAQNAARDAELIASLDRPQEFREATSFQVRDELQHFLERDLLGPWDGPTEELPTRYSGPRERYLVGALGPRHQTPLSSRDAADQLPDSDAEADGAASGEGSGELPEKATTQNLGHLWASTMGLSFSVPADTDAVHVRADWGQYGRESVEEDEGKKRSVWVREPKEFEREIRLDGKPDFKVGLTDPDPGSPCVYLAVSVREDRDGLPRRTVELNLVNNRLPVHPNGDTMWLFQARLSVTALDGSSPVFLPVDDPLDGGVPASDDPEELHLRLLYRDLLKYADGRNIAVDAEVAEGARRAHRLTTTWLPHHDVPATTAAVGAGSALASAQLSMDVLASPETGTDALRAGLLPLADGYSAWLDGREAAADELPEALRETADTAVFRARRAAERIRAGIDLLTDPAHPRHGEALRAFRFANRAMADQRRHSEISRLREDPEVSYAQAREAVNARGASAASWRPFQLAFVLLNLPAITDPDHDERAASAEATVDLLFFPTGGGKTEAYLGLTAFTFAIRRLQGVVGSGADARDGGDGVAVLMRYTLRLLTAQQFQRAAALVCAAEVQRAEDPATWGERPFRIGLWVGGGVSPNWFDEAEKQIAEARERGRGERANVLQTLSCPWCGTKLQAHRDLDPRHEVRRVLLFCANGEGADACPFSQRRSDEGLPILTVDEEIYRYTPSLLIATVDKLAQLPWRGFAGMLFGRVAEYCPRHGYRHPDLNEKTGCRGRHNAKGPLPKVESVPVRRLRPPDLVIQDELHLISGALGTTVGLFEAAVDELTSWTTPSGKRTSPKIVASTATTKRAGDQVRGVFGRGLEVFPPQVTEVSDTFFSTQVEVTPANPGRRYMGVCAHGVRLKAAEIRLAEILALTGQHLFDTYGAPADPYMTTVGYFNATRELAGMRRHMDDDVTVRARRHGRERGMANRLTRFGRTSMFNVQELTSRISSADISDVLKRLEIGFDPELDTSERKRAVTAAFMEARRAWESRSSAARQVEPHPLVRREGERHRETRDPVDTVLATSMLQVGVDVSRFGLMVMTGQPKNTAEYIQATSRVGRDAARPGLVVTLYNWTRPRDLGHYEDFGYYHATFYRQVEALSVTPFTRRALDRGTAAMFVAAVRHAQEDFSRNGDAHDVDLDGPAVEEVAARMLARAEFVAGERGRDYLAERINSLRDHWKQAREGSTRLGYERSTRERRQLRGLLTKPGEGSWSETTVGMSMRETENEINLLVSGSGDFFRPVLNEPPWSFAPPSARGDEGTEDERTPAPAGQAKEQG
ncbi:DISARM system helicase DrmA [Nocardiopsis dassonvillei]|uniref:DISARM system helicase DrmA n=1 Tax=Nocardiopsis dassonvillei TaxID=2014 RepID=UPI00200F45F9|nr:DISARM system helicase DrmA [Nocardiopsis dassonvillei]MCK9869543.1 DISARM system helicase DrmA [Nocardiopsis dassonvillei]